MSNIIGITMGDPCGVGPEITVRALAEMSSTDRAATRIYGNLATLEAAREALGVSIDLTSHVVDLPVEGAPLPWGHYHRWQATPHSASLSGPCAMPKQARSAASSPHRSIRKRSIWRDTIMMVTPACSAA